jgi:glycosyltransferase involved in cell wall biosynthesis
MKVLHAPLNYANQAYVLSQALKAQGVDSSLLRYRWEINDAKDEYNFNEDRVATIGNKDWFGDLLRIVGDVAAQGFDIVHLWNRSLIYRRQNEWFNGLDLPFLRHAGARLAYRFTGYELRRKSLELELNPFSPFRYGFDSGFAEDDQKRYLDSIAPYVDAFVVQDPEMQCFLPRARVIPRALDLERFSVVEAEPKQRPLVVHAPTNRLLKGSDAVVKAVQALQAQGVEFYFRLIEGMSYEKAVDLYRQADIVVDQLLIGWYGVVAIEAMAMGKTVIAYIRDDLTGYFRNEMPLLNANPKTIEAVLRDAVKDRELRQQLGQSARAFVERVHDSRIVARSVIELYEEMLAAPPFPRIPNFGYLHAGMADSIKTEHQLAFYYGIVRQMRAANPQDLQRRIALLNSGKLEAEALRAEKLAREVISLRAKADRYDRIVSPWKLLRRSPDRGSPQSQTSTDDQAARTETAVAPASPAARPDTDASDARGSVCIVSRKRLSNVTRAPRMAKALIDAGYKVVVISPARPVRQLQEMCPEVEYIEVYPRPFTADLIDRLRNRQRRRQTRAKKREERYEPAQAGGGARALTSRVGRAATLPLRAVGSLLWHAVVTMPSAALLRTSDRGFAETWRTIANEDAIALASRFAMIPHQWTSTHALAAEADAATAGRRFDIVQAYDNYALVAAARLASRDGAKLIYDAVELSSHRLALDLNVLESTRERLERREEARIFRKAHAMITIGGGLADWYARHYGINRPLVVRNCRYYWHYEADARLRADCSVGPGVRLLLWCGSIYPQQGIEIAIKTLPHLSAQVHLAIVGFAQPFWKTYATETLPALAASLGVSGRVHFLREREPNDLVPYISGADVGLVPFPSDQPNNFHSLSNKFLEMVMARLPIASSRLGETVDTINEYRVGAAFDERDFAKTARAIEEMLEPKTYARLKENVGKAAEVLKWETESRPYVELIDSLMPEHLRKKAVAERSAEKKVVTPSIYSKTDGAKPRESADDAGLVEENNALRGQVERLKSAHRHADSLAQIFRENHIVNAYLRVARYCHAAADEIKADAYVAHGVEALPAAEAVANAVGGRVYCDVIEMPSFAQRSVKYNWHPTNLALLDHGFEGYLRNAAGISTIGWALKDKITHYGPPVTVIPNYRYRETLQRSDLMRQKCGLRPEDRLLLASSTITSGFEPIIEALTLLPEHVHLATLGNIIAEYRERIRDLPARLGVASRVHYFNPVPYEQLTSAASGANIGIVAIDPSFVNDWISLPNRFFDSISAGLPIVTPDVPDIARIVRERNIGFTVRNNDARSWAEAITSALANEQVMRPNVLAASRELAWDSLGDELLAAYGRPKSVTFIAYCDLIGHQRTARMADTLVKRGVKVTICCPRREPASPDEMPGARFVFIPPPLGEWEPPKITEPVPVFASLAAPTAGAAQANGPLPPDDKAATPPKNGAVPAPALPYLVASNVPLTRAEQVTLERLKKEVIQLRYKARRYDELKDKLPRLQAKAARYDRLVRLDNVVGSWWRRWRDQTTGRTDKDDKPKPTSP